MQKSPNKLEEEPSAGVEKTPEKQSAPENENTPVDKNDSTPLKGRKDVESQFKTPEKASRPNLVYENGVTETKTPVKIEFKTPEKTIQHELSPENNEPKNKTRENDIINNKTLENAETKTKMSEKIEFKTPEKNTPNNQTTDTGVTENRTPEKSVKNVDLKLESISSFDGEDGMISTMEQARLLIAASRTPSKSINRTPVKQNTPSAKRALEDSPITPGKHRRVELITLASPKAKRIKQMIEIYDSFSRGGKYFTDAKFLQKVTLNGLLT